MRHAREIIRLKSSCVSAHEIARRLGMARSTVRETLKRADAAGLSWPLPDDMTDGALEAALYASRRSKRGHRRIAEPDWSAVHRELKRKHVTLLILWDEYIAANPGGYSYSRFCELYRSFDKTLSVTMRQTHAAGERLFVDYAGDGAPVVIDRLTGEIRMAQIFVAVLGASSFTFAKATWTQALPDWIDAHVRAFEAIGGVPELVVPDNAKTAVVKASFYDPQVNRTYAEMAAHYGTAILPARPRKPRDKAKVEQAVLIVERWLLGRLRRRIFYSLTDVDAALGELMTQLNEGQALRRLGVTRRQLLEEVDRPALKALPDERLRIQRVARAPGRRRLSRRHRRPLLFRPLPLRPRRGRGAPDRPRRRDLPQGRAHRRPFKGKREPEAHDCPRAHAVQPPALRRLDDRAHPGRRPQDRPGDRGALRADPRGPASSRAGISRLSRHRPSCRSPLARRASRPPPSGPSRSAPGPMAPSNPSSTTSSIGGPRPSAPRTRPRSAIPTSAGRATTIRRRQLAQTSDPRPASHPRPPWNGQGFRRSRRSRPGQGFAACRLARPAPRPGGLMAEGQTPDRAAARRKTAPAGERRGRRLSRRPRSRTAPCSRSSRRANGSTPMTISPWSGRPASARAGSPAPSATKPAATIDPSSIIAGRSSATTWRSPEATAAIRASSNPSAEPICSFSTTSASSPSTPAPVMTSSKSLRSDTAADRRSSPPSFPLSVWHEVIGDPTYADAILDRLVHNAHRIELTGESLRRTRGKQPNGLTRNP